MNEIEVGWDDLEHLRQVVVRLRGEMAAIRNGSSMPSITEEDGTRPPMSHSLAGISTDGMIDLGQQYSDLSIRYAKVTAELAKAQLSSRNSSAENFAAAVEPVVEEYEKSLSALESQLSLIKAALSHSEESMREKDEKVAFESQANQNNTKTIGELKARLLKLVEREKTTESYVHDLETHLKTSTEKDEQTISVVADLKKEIAKYREVAMNNEQYIKDLENRLGKSEEIQQMQKTQMESLELNMQRREGAFKELERRLTLLDTTEQHKEILAELDQRDERLMSLQHALETARAQVELLETGPRSHNSNGSTLENGSPSTLATTNHTNSTFDVLQDREALLTRIEGLQEINDRATANLDAMSTKFNESQQALANVRQGVEGRRRKDSSNSDSGESIAVSLKESTINDDDIEELQDSVRSARLPTNNSNSSYITPTRSSRIFRRSMPISPHGSFLGRSPVMTLSASHLRSASLSQELSVAQSLKGGGTTPRLSPGPSSPSPRSISPVLFRKDSFLSIPQQPSPGAERSTESLLSEIRKLQETLEEREHEIRHLETSLSRHRLSVPASFSDLEQSESIFPTEQAASPFNITDTSDSLLPYPDVLRVLDVAKASNQGQSTVSTGLAAEEQLERLNNLMLSMAKKEVTHREQVNYLEGQLSSLRRQNEEAKTLSKDQLDNMLSEMRALEERIATGSIETNSFKDELAEIQVSLEDREKQIAELLSSAQNNRERDLKVLEEKHSQVLKDSQEQDERSLLQVRAEHAAILHGTLEAHGKAILHGMEEQSAALHLKDVEHEEQLRIIKLEKDDALIRLRSEHEANLLHLQDEHAVTIQEYELEQATSRSPTRIDDEDSGGQRDLMREETFEKILREVQADHEMLLSTRLQEHSDAMSQLKIEHASSLARLEADHSAVLQEVRNESDKTLQTATEGLEEQIKEMLSQHTIECTSLESAHAEALRRVTEEHDDRCRQLETAHKAEVAKITGKSEEDLVVERDERQREVTRCEVEHQAALESLTSGHNVALRQISTSHTEAIETVRLEHVERVDEMQKGHEEALLQVKMQAEGAASALQSVRPGLLD